MAFKTIYLTGAPASGKTTVGGQLEACEKPVLIWRYGERLRQYLQERQSDIAYEAMRQESSSIITADDIRAVDARLLDFVSQNRPAANIIIDSHAVTREDYGFRITGFTTEQLQALDVTEIWVMFASPEVTIERIKENGAGRPLPDLHTAAMHTQLQASLAAAYGIVAGCPVYYFDSGLNQEEQLSRMIKRLGS